ncbi:MAG: FeoB-associated Cys-rich membrane protein [Clostridia bacterium]|nr:FeoB-associated Cys-rich membrane protein [Clostridia bacterium]
MIDVILVLIFLAVIGGAGWYLYRAKRKGQTCIGCPHAKTCGKKQCNGK